MPMKTGVKFPSPQNISGAPQRNTLIWKDIIYPLF